MNFFIKYKSYIITVIICFLYSVSDEIHQYFVPGRACRILDIIIDTSGSVFFCLLFFILTKFLRKYKKAK